MIRYFKGVVKVPRLSNGPTVTYQNIKILTKNKKHKIILVRLSLFDLKKNKISIKILKDMDKIN